MYEKYSIRRYGAHGTSHRYVSMAAAKFLGKDPSELKMITCHLGNGSSITAVDGGKLSLIHILPIWCAGMCSPMPRPGTS